VIVGDGGKLIDEPGHEIDPDHCELALGGSSEQRAPALRAAVEHGDPQMLQVRPGRDFLRPDSRSDQLWRDNKSMPAVPVADQLGERRERGRALAGTKGRDQNSSVAFIEPGCGPFLIAAQDASVTLKYFISFHGGYCGGFHGKYLVGLCSFQRSF
jgi:hypothetical protein